MVEGVTTALEDAFPVLRRRKKIFLAVLCIVFFLLGEFSTSLFLEIPSANLQAFP